jgi:transcription elongation factor Elf1
VFKTKGEELSHEESHKAEDGHLKFNLETCEGRLFDSRRKLVRHITQVHDKDQDSTYTCLFCDKTFRGLAIYQKHLKQFPYNCETCGSNFTTKWSRLSHMKKHESAKPHTSCMCHICSKIFNSKSSLSKHLISFHVDKKDYKFKCDSCEKNFQVKSKISRHMVMHTVFTCAICGDKFLTKPTLEQHEKTHTGGKNLAFVGRHL